MKLCFLIFCCISLHAFSQSNNYAYRAKMVAFCEKYKFIDYKQNELVKILPDIETEFIEEQLSSDGFGNFVFFKVKRLFERKYEDSDSSGNLIMSLEIHPDVSPCDGFVVAIDTFSTNKVAYCLRGFYFIDMLMFIHKIAEYQKIKPQKVLENFKNKIFSISDFSYKYIRFFCKENKKLIKKRIKSLMMCPESHL